MNNNLNRNRIYFFYLLSSLALLLPLIGYKIIYNSQAAKPLAPYNNNLITLKSPQNGSQFNVGQTIPITWVSKSTVTGPITIHYSIIDTKFSKTLVVPNNGYYPLNTSNLKPGQYSIYLSSTSKTYQTATRPIIINIFKPIVKPTDIPKPTPKTSYTLTLKTPNGGETLGFGTSFPITWSSSNNYSKLDIFYASDIGFTGNIISGLTKDLGAYIWKVNPVTGEGIYKIYIKAYDIRGKNVVSDNSDNYFRVVK